MKKPAVIPKNWISIRVKPEEYTHIYNRFRNTTCRSLSEYVKDVLLQKPVVISYRNQSAIEMMEALIAIKKELNYIGHNYNQVVRKLNSLQHLPEYADWLLRYDDYRVKILEKIAAIELQMLEMNRIWSQK